MNFKNQNSQDVIKRILGYANPQTAENNAHIDEQKQLMDAPNFFTENNADGITSKALFLEYVKSLGEVELQGFGQFCTDVSDGTKLTIPFFKRMDKQNNAYYYWVSMNSKTISRGYKLPWFPALDKFIRGYQFELYKFELSLEALFEEATKTS